MKICVLLGGASPERTVSLASGTAVGKALTGAGHEVMYMDPATALADMDGFRKGLETYSMEGGDFKAMAGLRDHYFLEQVQAISEWGTDIVFNALHGGNGENGVIAAVLEMAGLPFTGSAYAASAAAMDKQRTKILAEAQGVPCAEAEIYDIAVNKPQNIDYPLVVKPNDAGSSVGLTVFMEEADLSEACRAALTFSPLVMIERYIPGREFNIPVICGEAYPVLEVDTGGVYDFNAKYLGHKTQYLVPAPISSDITRYLKEQAVKVWKALGLKNYARIDFRMTPEEDIYLLEANTLPGMTASSLVPKSAKAIGISFPELLEIIIRDALGA